VNSHPLRNIEASEIEAFHRDGAILLKNVLSSDWLAVLEEGLEQAYAAPTATSAGVGEPLRIDHFTSDHIPQLRRLIHQGPIAQLVGEVLNSPVRFYMDQVFHKTAGPVAETPWHQDTCYYNIAGNDLIRAWVSPDRVPRNVSMEVIRGSHLWNVTYHPWVGRDPETDPAGAARADQAFNNGEAVIGADAHQNWSYGDAFADPVLPSLPDIERYRDSFEVIGWDYEPGDVLLFHGHIIHGALGGVSSPTPRRAQATMWAGDDVHYLHRRGQVIPDPLRLYDHKPADGDTLNKFPDVFPVVWSPSKSR
jgi:ectoine hydroxylase-related dioxygenase (phytanoyl-CoA dioxygenase family)